MDIDALYKSVPNATEDASRLYNTTLNLAARVLELSTRMLARIRSLDDVFVDNSVAQGQPYSSTTAAASGARRAREHDGSGVVLPGPWGFVTSGYFLGLLVMAFVLNRIHNIVVPRRSPLAFRLRTARHHRSPLTLRRLLLSSVFPVDLTSTISRCIFRIPTIYLLTKAIGLWSVLLLQAAGLYPSWNWSWLQTLDEWAVHKQFPDVCWFTFTSACTALSVAALTNGLDGLNLNNNAPFNLFSFAFQLYIFASPTTHEKTKDGLPSRPDKHVMITIILPLLQLTITHFLELKQKWARLRLVPTTLCAVLGLIHFHSVVWTSPSSYPLTNFVPCIVESLLVSTILFAVGLNALTQLLLEGTITRPPLGHAALLPKWDEDFSFVLFRLGTASLEASAVAGLGNEVGGVVTADAHGLAHADADADAGEVEVDRAGVVALSPAFERRGSRRTARAGFANEIKKVKAHAKHADLWLDAVMDTSWHREFGRFLSGAWRAGRRILWALWALVRGRPRHLEIERQGGDAVVTPEDSAAVGEAAAVELETEAEAEAYERFLRGEPVSDDEDEFLDASLAVPLPETSSSEADGDDDVDEESAQLYAELSTDAARSASAPLLVAHMASPAALTRRRFSRLVADAEPSEDMAAFVRRRRAEKGARRARSPSPEQSRWTCVVCTTEPREIICWPCRCLALCDDCRENLASRSAASKHICPCCRRSVEGYSKIYIP